ncbi:MAG TPA: hypothetical protein P5052_01740 [Candidatus Paceibacterota bacterium]|nr:hypothetical protein [Candidatus Paceibacterota bacterium]
MDITNPKTGFLVVYQTIREIIAINNIVTSSFVVPPIPVLRERINITKDPKKYIKAK